MFNTPILFLIFNRPATTIKVFQQIRKIKPKYLYVAADGPRNHIDDEFQICELTRNLVLANIDWDCELKILFRDKNLGCGNAISEALKWFFSNVEYGIVLEDDCLPENSFFSFCEEMLIRFKNQDNIKLICGTNYLFEDQDKLNDGFFYSHFSPVWGWASWKRVFNDIEWDKDHLKTVNNVQLFQKGFLGNKRLASWLYDMTEKTLTGNLDTWDTIVALNIFNWGGLNIIPNKNLISNIGIWGAHNNGVSKNIFLPVYPIDINRISFNERTKPDERINREMFAHLESIVYEKKSMFIRIVNKLKSIFNNFELHHKTSVSRIHDGHFVKDVKDLVPIVLFVYNRPNHTRTVLESLSGNFLSELSTLFIFCDGIKLNSSQVEKDKIEEVRSICKERNWCGKVIIRESVHNKGLAESVIRGVTEVVNEYGKVIVLEDDVVVSPLFLDYMNKAINFCINKPEVYSVSGYMYPMGEANISNYFYLSYVNSWGWATWKNAWSKLNLNTEYLLDEIERKEMMDKFDFDGSYPYFDLLNHQKMGNVDSWAIRWYATILLEKGLTLFPQYSYVKNIGQDFSGTHSFNKASYHENKYYKGRLNLDPHYYFPEVISEDKNARKYVSKSLSKLNRIPLLTQIANKLKNILSE